MPNLRTESFGAGDQTWLATTHAIGDAVTATLDLNAFTKANHYPNGFIPSGTPVNYADLKAVKPFTGADDEEGGTGEKLGFVLFDAPVRDDSVAPVAVAVHGIIKADKVPGDFTVPVNVPGFVFTNGGAS